MTSHLVRVASSSSRVREASALKQNLIKSHIYQNQYKRGFVDAANASSDQKQHAKENNEPGFATRSNQVKNFIKLERIVEHRK